MVILLKDGTPNEVNVLDVYYPSLTCPCDTDNYISPFFKKKNPMENNQTLIS